VHYGLCKNRNALSIPLNYSRPKFILNTINLNFKIKEKMEEISDDTDDDDDKR
jgi:hypothetical protein